MMKQCYLLTIFMQYVDCISLIRAINFRTHMYFAYQTKKDKSAVANDSPFDTSI